MPKFMRNFWFYAEVDGLKRTISSGPKSLTGGMHIDLMVNDNGISRSVLKVNCVAKADGRLVITIDAAKSNKIIQMEY